MTNLGRSRFFKPLKTQTLCMQAICIPQTQVCIQLIFKRNCLPIQVNPPLFRSQCSYIYMDISFMCTPQYYKCIR